MSETSEYIPKSQSGKIRGGQLPKTMGLGVRKLGAFPDPHDVSMMYGTLDGF